MGCQCWGNDDGLPESMRRQVSGRCFFDGASALLDGLQLQLTCVPGENVGDTGHRRHLALGHTPCQHAAAAPLVPALLSTPTAPLLLPPLLQAPAT